MKIAVKDLRPNPFRDLTRYPEQREKVDTLKASIKDTTFWDNLLVRKTPDGYEIAYGHNRLKALRELRIEEVDIPVRKIDDTQMAQIMARENMEEWGASATIEQETVRAVVEAYGAGKIELPKVSPRSPAIRYAPHFGAHAPKSDSDHPYTADSLAKFLGWKEWRVDTAIQALATIEEALIDTEDFEDLTPRQAQEVARQTRRVMTEHKDAKLAKKIGKNLASDFRHSAGKREKLKRSGNERGGRERQAVTIHTAKHRVDVMTGDHLRKQLAKDHQKPMPDIDAFAWELMKQLGNVLELAQREKLARLAMYRGYLSTERLRNLIGALDALILRATKFRDTLKAPVTEVAHNA